MLLTEIIQIRPVNLQRIVNSIIKQYKRGIIKHQKQLKLNINQNFLTLKDKRMINIYVNRGYFDYFGIIYRIIDKRNGKLLYGFTLDSLKHRWSNYKFFAIKNKYSEYLLPIEEEILKVINMGLNPDRVFIIKPVDICFDYNTLRKREDYWINRHDTRNRKKGYNSNKGGGGGPKILIPMDIVAKYIASGYKATEITELLNKKYNIFVGCRTVSRRINEYWGNRLSAQKKFLKPVLVNLIIKGYSSNDIISTFGSHGRNIIDRLMPKIFDEMSFSEVRAYYLTEIIKKLIIKGLGQKEMAKKLRGFGEKEIYNRIIERWGSLKEARKELWIPIIIKKLRSNWTGKDIFISLGYSESTAISKHNEIMCRLFSGKNTKQARQHFKNLN